MSDIIKVIFHNSALDLNLLWQSSYHCKTKWLAKWASTLVPPKFVTENRDKFELFQCFVLRLFWTILFLWAIHVDHYVRCRYSNALAIQIDFCFPKFYFSLIIPTQTELLVEVNCLNKTIGKLVSKDVSLRRISFYKYIGKSTNLAWGSRSF